MVAPALDLPTRAVPAGRRRSGRHRRESAAGLLFVSPAILMLLLFMLVPILMAFWVSLTKWTGQGSPLKGKAFFRTAFYFPSVTSSVAISIVFLFMFTGGGAINAVLSVFGVRGPAWFSDADGVIHIVLSRLGVSAPGALVDHGLLGLSWWDWLSGPSVAMCAIIALVVWTTSGTFMLMFLAALQDIPVEVEEASLLDGVNRRQQLRYVILPMLRPTMFLVITLGLIGSWQVFDQIYIMSQGGPGKTTLSPAYVSYATGFQNQNFPAGAAMSFVLFAIIVLMTVGQRWLLRDRDASRERRASRRRGRA